VKLKMCKKEKRTRFVVEHITPQGKANMDIFFYMSNICWYPFALGAFIGTIFKAFLITLRRRKK